ncbi:MAG TPA: 1-deoxy-D-xylulose-5-phosphate synthase N-terminal domain-containing protein [Euzebyales bacterium]
MTRVDLPDDAAVGADAHVDADVLTRIEQRVLWLAVRMVDIANTGDAGGIKVGGHQASSASMVSLMTALWFGHLRRDDKVAVKPHASPVYHAIKYLTGELDRAYLTRLRRRGGLQAYPSRTKDPDVADFSTGSVGLGAVAPLFSAATRRYVDRHFGDRPPARCIATVGDAELDEGNVWEAIADPVTAGLGNVMLIVDLNRQSLDRVVPGIASTRLQRFFADAGWHVVEAKYGRRLQAMFAEPHGDALRAHIDAMPNEAYQALFAHTGAALRERAAGADPAVRRLLDGVDDEALPGLLFNLGGHDHDELLATFAACDAEASRPSIVFAYTIKGWGLPIAGDPLNHSRLLTSDQIDDLRVASGLPADDEWARFDPDSPEGRLCAAVGEELNNVPPPPRPSLPVPTTTMRRDVTKPTSTQEAFGRTLTALADDAAVGPRLVTASPDVSISTNLGSWINKAGVFAPAPLDDHGGADRLLRWAPGPDGRHVELGISEMNLFLLLCQLGLAHEHHGELLLPVGTVYDPFVLRGLDAFVYALYSGARFVLAGTPSGVTLAPEGGAHQSTITASVGVELPGVAFAEPTYAAEVDWLLCDGLGRLTAADGESLYLRLSTRPIDQSPFHTARRRMGDDGLRADVLAGGYRLITPSNDGRPRVDLVASGAIVPDVLAAATVLDDEGVDPAVTVVTSADRLYRGWQAGLRSAAAHATARVPPAHLGDLLGGGDVPIVSAHDASGHALAWLGSAVGAQQIPLGVERFGESGTIADLYDLVGISTDHIVNAALLAIAGVT